MKSRRLINLVTVALASGVLLLFAVTQLLATAILDNSYPVYIELPEAGGLLENKEITYRGVSVGEVIDVTLCDDVSVGHGPDCADAEGVRVEMGIDDGVRIPEEVDVVVLRQSAVGEQALDLRPRAEVDDDTAYYEEGDLIVADGITLPTKPQDLLELANEVFGPVDEANAAIVVSELADAVQGRSDDLRRILVDSAVLSEAVGDNGADYDRFFAASRIVNASLAENREVLTQLITDLADGAQLIGDIRGEIDGLLDTAPGVLSATTSLLERGDANLSCIIEDIGNLNAFVNLPENRDNLEEGLRVNEYFFHAFRIIGPTSAQGDPWLRVHFLMEPVPPPALYTPPRPIPATLPGGACESVFGPGAGSAVQANHQLAVPEGQVVRPENDRRPAFAAAEPSSDVAAAGEGAEAVDPLAAAVDTGSTASSPLVALAVLAAVVLLGAGIRLAQMRSAAQTAALRRTRRPRPTRRGRGGDADG